MTKREEVIAAMERRIKYIIDGAPESASRTVAAEVWLEPEEILAIWNGRGAS